MVLCCLGAEMRLLPEGCGSQWYQCDNMIRYNTNRFYQEIQLISEDWFLRLIFASFISVCNLTYVLLIHQLAQECE